MQIDEMQATPWACPTLGNETCIRYAAMTEHIAQEACRRIAFSTACQIPPQSLPQGRRADRLSICVGVRVPHKSQDSMFHTGTYYPYRKPSQDLERGAEFLLNGLRARWITPHPERPGGEVPRSQSSRFFPSESSWFRYKARTPNSSLFGISTRTASPLVRWISSARIMAWTGPTTCLIRK